MARSLALDVVQLNFGQFISAYNWGNRSESEYLLMRAELMKAPHSTLLVADRIAPPNTVLIPNTILTGLYVACFGSTVTCQFTITGPGGLYNFNVTTVEADGASVLNLTGLELPATSLTFNDSGGSPIVDVIIFGYTPPTVNP